MKGKIYRVTYNVIKQSAILHMENGDVMSIPMTDDEWKQMCTGDVNSNFEEFLDTLYGEFDKEMEKRPYLLNPKTGEKTYYEK